MEWIEGIGEGINYIEENITEEISIKDIALKYGYASPDSFTKAFTRFHGVTPTAVRKDGAMIKSFAPLKIKFSLEGGYIMDYKIVKKDSFTVMGVSKVFRYDSATTEIPQFWTEHYNPCIEIPNGFVTKIIPKYTWAVFASRGAMPKSLLDVSRKIFSEWLPNCKDYEIVAGYNIEMYTDPADYPQGSQDENYYSEMWIPVKKK